MWIISKKRGVVNTDNVSGIEIIDWRNNAVYAYDGPRTHYIADGVDDYHKILEALRNEDKFVEVD